MKPIYLTLSATLVACAGSGGESGEIFAESGETVAIGHEKGQQPRGYLEIEAEGKWLYGGADTCTHTKGSIAPAKVAEITSWANDPALKAFVKEARCGETDYVITHGTTLTCLPEDEIPDVASAKSLVATFAEYAGKLDSDVKSECLPDLTATPMNPKHNDPPPPSMADVNGG